MSTTKLELKHLAPYLPYGLKVKVITKSGHLDNVALDLIGAAIRKEEHYGDIWKANVEDFGITAWYPLGDVKPILRPLSDLTKEIEHNGERFVPIQRLGYDKVTPSPITRLLDDLKNRPKLLPYWLFEKLFEWHFDVFGLIEAGLAIDINTIDQ